MQSKADAKEDAKAKVSRKTLHKGLGIEARFETTSRFVFL